jgi:hypothetical protein
MARDYHKVGHTEVTIALYGRLQRPYREQDISGTHMAEFRLLTGLPSNNQYIYLL